MKFVCMYSIMFQHSYVNIAAINCHMYYICVLSMLCTLAYFDKLFISTGLSPKVSVVNHTDTFEVTTDTTTVSLYFEVYASPRLTSEPRLTVNNSDLSSKWKVIYKSLNMSRIIHYNSWSHFLIEITTEDFTEEDSGVYMLTVSNTCSSSNKTVTIKGKCLGGHV